MPAVWVFWGVFGVLGGGMVQLEAYICTSPHSLVPSTKLVGITLRPNIKMVKVRKKGCPKTV